MGRRLAGSAVVLGGSMAGLLAARVLSGQYGSVTVLELDALAADAQPRKGVLQAAHVHGLLASGYRAMDRLFPGMMDELEAAGAPRADVTGDFLWYQRGRWKLRDPRLRTKAGRILGGHQPPGAVERAPDSDHGLARAYRAGAARPRLSVGSGGGPAQGR
jgi:2-polyprenyl-6-methoxyphenol hydroxylase-like FAD-dependent oxidoreductase